MIIGFSRRDCCEFDELLKEPKGTLSVDDAQSTALAKAIKGDQAMKWFVESNEVPSVLVALLVLLRVVGGGGGAFPPSFKDLIELNE